MLIIIFCLKFEDSTACILLLRVQVKVHKIKRILKATLESKMNFFLKSKVNMTERKFTKTVHTYCCNTAAVLRKIVGKAVANTDSYLKI